MPRRQFDLFLRSVPGWAWVLTAVTFGLYGWMGLYQWQHLQAMNFDMTIFSQAVDSLAHWHAPAVPVDTKAAGNFFGDHLSPVLVLLVPLWWMHGSPDTLVLAQAALLAASVPAVAKYTSRRLPPLMAVVLSVAYASFWGFAAMATFDFHEVAFAVPLLAWAIERADAGRFRWSAAAAFALLTVKEDLALVVVMLGVLYAALWRQRALGAALLAAGVGWFGAATQLVIPHLTSSGHFFYWDKLYRTLAPLPAAVPATIVHHPLRMLRFTFTPPKLLLLVQLLYPFAFLSVCSPLMLLAAPLLLERLWSDNSSYYVASFHYNATLGPVLVLGAADTLGRLRSRLGVGSDASTRLGVTARTRQLSSGALVAVMSMGALWAAGPFGLGDRAYLGSLRHTAAEQACLTALTAVPDRAPVEASNIVGPYLVPRAQVFMSDEYPGTVPYKVFRPAARGQIPGYRRVADAGDCNVWRRTAVGTSTPR
jgi:uncharacterized membrane protein